MSPSSHAYKMGDFRMVWDFSMVSRKWQDHRLIQHCNEVFKFYYHAARNIRNVEIYDYDLGRSMWKQLAECATDGYDDLYDVFIAAGEEPYVFDDGSSEKYYGGDGKFFPKLVYTFPEGVTNFLDAVDGKMKSLRKAVDHFNATTDQVTNALPRDDWTTVGDVLTGVKDYGERVKKYLWLAPEEITVDYKLDNYLGTAVTLADTFGKIHDGATAYANARSAGMIEDHAQAIGAMRVAVSFLPVLGDFYGKAIEMIPGLFERYKKIIEDRDRRIHDASLGVVQRSR